jgi:hypothetical protein
MTRKEFKSIIEPVAVSMRADFDEPTWLTYYAALKDVEPGLLRAAALKVAQSISPFFPKPGELRALAEQARVDLSAARKFVACDDCSGSGWETFIDDNGISRVRRCPCWHAHQQRLADGGLSSPIHLEAPIEARLGLSAGE